MSNLYKLCLLNQAITIYILIFTKLIYENQLFYRIFSPQFNKPEKQRSLNV